MLSFVHGCPPDLAPDTAHMDTEGTTMTRLFLIALLVLVQVLLLAIDAN